MNMINVMEFIFKSCNTVYIILKMVIFSLLFSTETYKFVNKIKI
jgi:hypothetical protein